MIHNILLIFPFIPRIITTQPYTLFAPQTITIKMNAHGHTEIQGEEIYVTEYNNPSRPDPYQVQVAQGTGAKIPDGKGQSLKFFHSPYPKYV